MDMQIVLNRLDALIKYIEYHDTYDERISAFVLLRYLRKMLQDILTPEEFRGWLKGSMFKYFCRAGKKPGEPYERDMAKCLQFNEWLKQAAAGKKINPREGK